MNQRVIKNVQGVVFLDIPQVFDEMTIYAYIYTDADDEIIAITDEGLLIQLKQELKKLGKCNNAKRIVLDDKNGDKGHVLSFDNFIKKS